MPEQHTQVPGTDAQNGNCLSDPPQDAESVIRCMAVSRDWHQAAKQVECLFFDGYQYRDRLSGQVRIAVPSNFGNS